MHTHDDGPGRHPRLGSGSERQLPAIWADALGRAGIRPIQALAVLLLATVIVYAATRVPLVLIPTLIALVLAAAISPVVRRLLSHGWPRAVLSCPA